MFGTSSTSRDSGKAERINGAASPLFGFGLGEESGVRILREWDLRILKGM